jgi:hypothetical protein
MAAQLVVRWQESQEAVVTTWPAGLPGAVTALWQLVQLPAATPWWVNTTAVQLEVR